MIIAIVKGKSGRVRHVVGEGASWRDAFRASEDLLTASVFGRISYLDGATSWKILSSAIPELPKFKIAELIDIEFWPKWSGESQDRQYVEPDIFMTFSAGDPPVSIELIFEAKISRSTNQYLEQWQQQWNAYREKKFSASEEFANHTYLIAIGGIGEKAERFIERQLERLLPAESEIKVVGTSWDNLTDTIYFYHQIEESGHKQRLLSDILEALALGGYRYVETLNNLIDIPIVDCQNQINIIQNYNYRCKNGQ